MPFGPDGRTIKVTRLEAFARNRLAPCHPHILQGSSYRSQRNTLTNSRHVPSYRFTCSAQSAQHDARRIGRLKR
jgi:hypothetical protein